MSLKKQIDELVSPYVDLPLECDGMTRVVSYLLRMGNFAHETFVGEVFIGDKSFKPHFWIELETGEMVDYRLRMWFGEKAPHGVFVPEKHKVRYEGIQADLATDKMIFDILTRPE